MNMQYEELVFNFRAQDHFDMAHHLVRQLLVGLVFYSAWVNSHEIIFGLAYIALHQVWYVKRNVP